MHGTLVSLYSIPTFVGLVLKYYQLFEMDAAISWVNINLLKRISNLQVEIEF